MGPSSAPSRCLTHSRCSISIFEVENKGPEHGASKYEEPGGRRSWSETGHPEKEAGGNKDKLTWPSALTSSLGEHSNQNSSEHRAKGLQPQPEAAPNTEIQTSFGGKPLYKPRPPAGHNQYHQSCIGGLSGKIKLQIIPVPKLNSLILCDHQLSGLEGFLYLARTDVIYALVLMKVLGLLPDN